MERFVKLYLLLVEVATDVLQKLFENRFKADNIPDFTRFLQNHSHELFHLCFTRSGPCCICQNQNTLGNQHQVINVTQFEKLFSKSGNISCGKNSRNHCCEYVVKAGLTLIDVDVTFGSSLILHFYQSSLNRQELDCIGNIRTSRNKISHYSGNSGIPVGEFYTLWGNIQNASIHLASCLSNHYRDKIQDEIKRLCNRDICVSESSVLVQRATIWQRENLEFKENMQSVHVKLDKITMDIGRIAGKHEEQKVVPHSVPRFTTEVGIDSEELEAGTNSLDLRKRGPSDDNDSWQEDQKYFQLYKDVEQLLIEGKGDQSSACKYLVLSYVVLRGSTEEDIKVEVLDSMSNSIFGSPFPELVDAKSCLKKLIPKYVEKIESTYTTSSVNVSRAVIYTYGGISPENLTEVCSFDVLHEFVIPDCVDTDSVSVRVKAVTLVIILLKKMNGQALGIGKYISKISQMEKGQPFLEHFIDLFVESDIRLSSVHMVDFLDGLTNKGEDFKIFEHTKMFNVICRQVDKFGNTVFHYFVCQYLESYVYEKYVSFFSEKNIITMLMLNGDNLSPLAIAAYLGRNGAVSSIINTMESKDLDEQLWDILSNVSEGLESLKKINSTKEDNNNKINIEIKSLVMGGKEDFECILKILDVDIQSSHIQCSGSEDDKDNESPEVGDDSRQQIEESDTSKVVGDTIISLATNIKKSIRCCCTNT